MQLLVFLVEIAKSDGHVCNEEIEALKEVAMYMGLSVKEVESMLNLGGSSLNEAYKVLEIEPTATNDEVRAAYRRLALKHHPDRVATLGEDIKKAAEEKFQSINNAKEQIYKARGMNPYTLRRALPCGQHHDVYKHSILTSTHTFMKKTLAILALGLTAIAGHAATPLWMRDVQISPDGTEIAFCYKGDIYKVPAKGGTATQLTTQESYECTPIWSPDGKQIAFASDRYGNFDVFVMPADGGTAQRLTTHSTGEIPSTFTPDGKYILFSASIQDPASSALFPTSAMTELYKVPATGGRTEQVLGTPAEAVCFDKAGQQFLYQDRKGFEDEWRKHHTSSITRDIWLYDAKTGAHTNLTDHAARPQPGVVTRSEDGLLRE